MLTAIGADVTTRLVAAAAETPPAASGTSWWDVTSGLLLALAGVWASWAQFVYPKIAERRARVALTVPPPPVSETPPAPTVDLVGFAFRNQAQRVDDLLDELTAAHRQARRDASTIARLTAELAECRRDRPHR